MIKVKLKHGVALFDDCDKKLLDTWKIFSWADNTNKTIKPYVKTWVYIGNKKNKVMYFHRILINAKNGEMVDHINGNGLDNRRNNLRIVNASQNGMNKKSKLGVSGFTGVTFCKCTNRWRAWIEAYGYKLCMGRYKTKEEAAEARHFAEAFLHGEYSYGQK